jgi:hypothetical protein
MNQKQRFCVVTVFLAMTFSSSAWGSSFYLESSFFPGYTSNNQISNSGITNLGGSFSGQPLNNQSGFSYDLRNVGGFMFWDRLLVGFDYNYSRAPLSATAAADNFSINQVTRKIEYGPSIGYFAGGLRLIFSYFLGGQETFTANSVDTTGAVQENLGLKNYLRNGYQFVLGYSFNLSPGVLIGPSVAYRHVSYKAQDASNTLVPSQNYSNQPFTTDANESTFTPMISLMFKLF